MAENRCISCGDIIPEGKIACKSCEDGKKVIETLIAPTKENYGIKFEKTEVWGFNHAFRNIRHICSQCNTKSDTKVLICENSPVMDIRRGELKECGRINNYIIYVEIGQNDITLVKKLIELGWEQQLTRLIHVSTDTIASFPNYEKIDTIETDYACLRTIYHNNKTINNKTCITWCKWIESLPYAKELICYKQ